MIKHILSIATFLIIVFSIASCKKDSTNTTNNNTNTGGAPAITSSYYFQAKIDGTWVTWQANDISWVSGYGSASGGGTTNYFLIERSDVSDFNETNSGGIGILKDNVIDINDYPTRYSLFTTGAKPYGKQKTMAANPVEGALVSYTVDGVEWSSNLGTSDQTGSTFSITEFIDNTDGASKKIVGATFSCKLYNGLGGVKTVTDGKFRGRIID